MLSEPIGWQRKKIKEIGDVVGGGTPDRGNLAYWNGSIPWATPTDITALKTIFISRTKECISDEGLAKSSAKLHPKGTVLMTSRATIAYPAIAAVPIATNQGFQSIRCKNGISNKFIYYSLIGNRARLEKLSSGSTFAELSSSVFKEFELALPPYNEQTEISRVLSIIDACLESNDLLLNKVTDLKKALLQELFTKGIGHKEFKDSPLGRIPITWNFNILNNVIKIIDCKHITPKFVDEGYPFIRPRNVKSEGLDFSDIDHISENDFMILTDKHKPKKGDIIFSRNATFGIPSYNDTDIDFAIGQDVVVMTETDLPSKYIFFFLQSEIAKQQIMKVSTGSTFNRINLEFIRKLQVFVPPMAEQEKIINVFDSLEKRIKGIKAKIDSFIKLKQALMQDLLSGKVRVKIESQELAGVIK